MNKNRKDALMSCAAVIVWVMVMTAFAGPVVVAMWKDALGANQCRMN